MADAALTVEHDADDGHHASSTGLSNNKLAETTPEEINERPRGWKASTLRLVRDVGIALLLLAVALPVVGCCCSGTGQRRIREPAGWGPSRAQA